MPDVAVLDVCVLYPLPLRTRSCGWPGRPSTRVVAAVGSSTRWRTIRSWICEQAPSRAAKLIDAMTEAFEDAEIPAAAIAALEPVMTTEPADRHVLAGAVASGDVNAIMTLNLRHFRAGACEPFGIDVFHPHAFLCDLFQREPTRMHQALKRQAAGLSTPLMSVEDILERLHATIPEFVVRVREAQPER